MRSSRPTSEEHDTHGLSRLFDRARVQDRLGIAEERELIQAARRSDRRAQERLIGANLAYVAKLALRYRGCGVGVDDLVHEGTLGLIEAIQRFDPERGTRFLTYATFWVRKAILEALAGQSHMVKLPSRARARLRSVIGGAGSGPLATGRPPRALPVELVHEATAWRWPASLDDATQQQSGPATPLRDVLYDESYRDIVDTLLAREARGLVRACLAELNPQQRFVVDRRFGLADSREWTLREIGDALGITRERARQIEEAAKQKLRRAYLRRERYRAPDRSSPSPN